VCALHYLGVAHGDLAPRNVLRKKWSFLFKIIDFGFSDVRHTCPGWRECGELKEVRRELHLDRVEFVFRFRNRLDSLLLIFITGVFVLIVSLQIGNKYTYTYNCLTTCSTVE